MGDFDPAGWITTQEAAALTGYAAVTWRLFARQGRIKSMKRGRDWFLDKAEVLAYTETMQRMGNAKHNPWREDLESQRRGRRHEDESGAE
ncbi:MAG TPA: helix-turn-helix domain-containing protein [Anaerolineaceae bacterium]|nr:helix-turn-helix domain-containing protein [Anaerolineaceae bacterium]